MADVLDVIRDCRKTIGWEDEIEDGYCDYESAVLRLLVSAESKEALEAEFGTEAVLIKDRYFVITEASTELLLKEKVAEGEGASFIRVMD